MSKEQEIINRANKISILLIESRLKEALNLYEELAHRQRVEAQQEAILRER